MELLGSLLFIFAFISWLYPTGFGRWLGRVRNGLRETSKPTLIEMTIQREKKSDD